jgi:two-component system CheB/CheR fusion protein
LPKRSYQREAQSRDESDRPAGGFPIVGIGASAGGLEALEKLFGAMPADTGMAFVVIQHLHPERESHMVELLARHTAMPVVAAEEGARVEPDHVYQILPNRELTIRDGVLHLAGRSNTRGAQRPVDAFLASLAEDQQERAIGVILSGTGSNGTAGIREIKGAGGMTIAQSPESAQHPGMPRNAIASGNIDVVLAPEQMPEALLRYARHPYVASDRAPAEPAQDPEPQLNRLLALLRTRAGHEFRCYKRSTLMRRIHRRMGLCNVERLDDYEDLLRRNPGEVSALVKDLMINVTGFFRDPEAWEALDERVIAPLVRERESGEPVRVWVPGCATGEEAYSVAMLLAERAEAAQKSFDVKIFATDTADDNLSTARRGLLPGTIEREVSQERLRRFFDPIDESYQIRKELRDWVVFAPQNLLRDPPFFRVDLATCRNLLIYLEEEAQRKVLALLHFALREGGHLFLGNAETIGRRTDLFETVSKKWRIYRRIGPTRHDIVDFPVPGRHKADASAPTVLPTPDQLAPTKLADIAERALAERFAPASVLIDRGNRILYFHGLTDRFLAQPAGEPTRDLLAMAREGLRGKLRSAVQRAQRDNERVSVEAWIRQSKDILPVTLSVAPLRGVWSEGVLLVSFEEGGHAPATPTEAPEPVPEDASTEREFEAELRNIREELSRTIEQLESSNEELKASNEEITSMNEELQSANEELETSKEELQSLNEELNTVNAQLQRKVEELEETTNDLSNLLTSTDVATVFLDRQFRIRFVTPAMTRLMDLTRADTGRPIGSFAMRFDDPSLLRDAETVIEKLVPSEAEVPSHDHRWYLRRIVPYRTRDDRIDGVVVTFTDVTTAKQADLALRDAHEHVQAIYDTVREPLLVLDPDLRVRSANAYFYDTFKVDPKETEGRLIYDLGNHQWDIPRLRELLGDILPDNDSFESFEVEHEFAGIGRRVMLLNGRRLDDAQLILLAIEDITDRRRWEDQQKLLVSELSHRVKNTLATVQSIAAQTARASGSLDRFQETFFGRIQALGRAHALLTQSSWDGAEMRDTVGEPLKAYDALRDRIRFSGQDLALKPHAAVTLTLVMHELGTNATKYGALSDSAGRLEVFWGLVRTDRGPQVRLVWNEAGGPEAKPPAKRGFGLTLIERTIAHELDGQVTFDFRKEGLRCEILIPYDPSSFQGVSRGAARP